MTKSSTTSIETHEGREDLQLLLKFMHYYTCHLLIRTYFLNNVIP